MIKKYREKLSHLNSNDLSGTNLFIKKDEITFIDHTNKCVYKRVFRHNMKDIQFDRPDLPIAKIVEAEYGFSQSEFILEYIEGMDVFMQMKLHKETTDSTLAQFDDFLSKWLKYDPNSDYLESFSFDINPGNFILPKNGSSIVKVDYLSDWNFIRKDLYYYLLPFNTLINKGIVEKSKVEHLINKRFHNHKNKNINFETMYRSLEANASALDISTPD